MWGVVVVWFSKASGKAKKKKKKSKKIEHAGPQLQCDCGNATQKVAPCGTELKTSTGGKAEGRSRVCLPESLGRHGVGGGSLCMYVAVAMGREWEEQLAETEVLSRGRAQRMSAEARWPRRHHVISPWSMRSAYREDVMRASSRAIPIPSEIAYSCSLTKNLG